MSFVHVLCIIGQISMMSLHSVILYLSVNLKPDKHYYNMSHLVQTTSFLHGDSVTKCKQVNVCHQPGIGGHSIFVLSSPNITFFSMEFDKSNTLYICWDDHLG